MSIYEANVTLRELPEKFRTPEFVFNAVQNQRSSKHCTDMDGQQHSQQGADQDGGGIYKGACEHADSSFSIRARTTALPRSRPAVAGTQGLLAGTLRRPGGGVSG